MALAANNLTRDSRDAGDVQAFLVKASTHIYAGGLVALDSTGYAIAATSTDGLIILGVAKEEADNSSGANGAIKVKVYRKGLFKFAKSGTFTQANVGDPAAVYDDNTVATGVPSLTTNLTGATQNDVVFTAKRPTATDGLGKLVTVEYRDPGGTTATASIEVEGSGIVVHLGRTASAVDTTADAMKTLLEAHAAAAALVSIADKTDNDGTGLLAAMAATPLAAGPIVGTIEEIDGTNLWIRLKAA